MNAHWAPAALETALRHVTGLGAIYDPPTELLLALSGASADPELEEFLELDVANYARQPVTLDYTGGAGVYAAATVADVSFTNLGACAYRGIRLYGAVTGTLWFWADLSIDVDVDEGETVTFAAGLIKVGLTG